MNGRQLVLIIDKHGLFGVSTEQEDNKEADDENRLGRSLDALHPLILGRKRGEVLPFIELDVHLRLLTVNV